MTVIRNIFNVYPGEGKKMLLFFSYFFCIIGSLIIGKTARDVFFLSRFNPNFLPYIFIISSVCVSVITLLYIRISNNKNLFYFSMVTGSVLASSLLIINIILNEWVYPVLYVWIDILAAIIVPQFWLLANSKFTSRQAKRLFGPIGAAAAFANIIIGFSMQFFITTLGTNILLPLSASLLILSVLVIYIIKRSVVDDYSSQIYTKNANNLLRFSIFDAIQNNRYIGLLCIIVSLGTITITFIEYQFKMIASQTYSENQLASLFGMLYGVVGLSSGFIQIFFVSRLLKRFGVLLGLLILPVLLGFSSIFLIISPVIIYALMARLSDLIFRFSMYDTTIQILWLPVTSKLKQVAKPFIDGTMKNFSQGLAGLLILMVISISGSYFINILIIIFILLWIICSMVLKKGYLSELRKSVGNKGLNLETFNINVIDSYLVNLFKKTLISGNQNQKIFIINEIKHLDPEPWTKELQDLFYNDSNEIRQIILDLSHYKNTIISNAMICDIINATNDVLQPKGMIIAAKRHLLKATNSMILYANDSAPDIKASANVALMHLDKGNNMKAAKRLDAMLTGSDVKLQIAALQAISHFPDLISFEKLLKVVTSDNLEIKQLIVKIAVDKQSEELIPFILSTLQHVETRKIARIALKSFTAHQVEPLIIHKLLINKYSLDATDIGFINVLGDIGTEISLKVLLEISPHAKIEILQDTIVDAFRDIAINSELIKSDSILIVKLFEYRLKHAYMKLQNIHLTDALDKCILLKNIYQTAFDREIIRLFLILDILYPDKLTHTYIYWFRSGNKAAISNVIEIIEGRMNTDIVKLFLYLIDEAPISEKISSGSTLINNDLQVVDEIIMQLIESDKPFEASLAIDAIINNNLDHIMDQIDWEKALNNIYINEIIRKQCQSGHLKIIESVQPLLNKSDTPKEEPMYTTLDKTIILKGVSLFSNLTSNELFQLAKIAIEERYLSTEIIFQEGAPGDAMYIIIDGSVQVYNVKKEIATLKTGECFGEMALLDQEPRSTSIRTITNVILLKIDESSFHDLIIANIAIMQGIVKILSKRLRKSIVH